MNRLPVIATILAGLCGASSAQEPNKPPDEVWSIEALKRAKEQLERGTELKDALIARLREENQQLRRENEELRKTLGLPTPAATPSESTATAPLSEATNAAENGERGGGPTTPARTTTFVLERRHFDLLVDTSIRLPDADMAQAPTRAILERSVVLELSSGSGLRLLRQPPTSPANVAVSVEWEIIPGAEDLTPRFGELTAVSSSGNAEGSISAGTPPIHVFLFADRAAPVSRFLEVVRCCRDANLRNLWLVARDARSGIGVLCATLPIQTDKKLSGTHTTRAILSIDDIAKDSFTRADLYETMYRCWQFYEEKQAKWQIEIRATANQPVLAVAGVLNEARRFGIGVDFNPASRVSKEPATVPFLHINPDVSALRMKDGSAAAAMVVPTKTDGAAVWGDPYVNPITASSPLDKATNPSVGPKPPDESKLATSDGSQPVRHENGVGVTSLALRAFLEAVRKPPGR